MFVPKKRVIFVTLEGKGDDKGKPRAYISRR
nr:MAG TPA: hypothetical protein [Caudoviricetes sp.]